MRTLFILLVGAACAWGQAFTLSDPALMGNVSQASTSAAFSYSASGFDGSTTYALDSDGLTSATNTKVFAWSGWIKATGGAGNIAGALSGSAEWNIIWVPAAIKVLAVNASGTEILDLRAAAGMVSNVWYPVQICVDTTDSAKCHIYTNGVDAMTWRRTIVNDSVVFASVPMGVSCRGDQWSKFAGELCEIWFAEEYLDFSVEANRNKFRSAGKPISLGADGSDTNIAAAVGALESVSSVLHAIPGNHDSVPGVEDMSALATETYAEYDAAFPNSRHWSITNGSIVFIGFTSQWDRTNDNGAIIVADEMAWLKTAITNAAGKSVVMLTHFPFVSTWDYGLKDPYKSDLKSTMDAHGKIIAWLSGHRHFDTMPIDYFTNGTTAAVNVSGPSMAYCIGSTSYRLDGCFVYGAVTNNQISLSLIRAKPDEYTNLGTNHVIAYEGAVTTISASVGTATIGTLRVQ